MKNYYLISIFTFFTFVYNANAQTSSGTEFWLGFMENLNIAFNDDPVFAIQISSAFSTSGIVSVPATGFTLPFDVTAGEQLEVILPAAVWYAESSEVIEGKGIKIISEQPIEVAATHFRLYFTEATGVLPTTELSDEYLTTCYKQTGNVNLSSFVVVGTTDATEIEITPTAFTQGLKPANIPFTITLNEGEIYQVQAVDDLTGSRVRAINGEKIAVFSGAQQAVVGETCFGAADNHLYEQCQPFDNWADLYYFVPFKNQGGDFVRILALEDNTTVYFDCVPTTTLQSGEYYNTTLIDATVISSTEPIAVSQFNESQDCNASGIGDPNMMTLLPTRNQTLRSNWRATPGTAGSSSALTVHFTNVIMKTEDIGLITLDGSSIENEFTTFDGDPNISFAQVSTTSGNHILTASAPFHSYYYGFGDYDAYTHTGDFQQIEEIAFACLEIEVEGEFCVDSIINFSATANFNIVTYEWETTDGQSSSLIQPNFTFSNSGTYVVSLTAFNDEGNSQMTTYEITISDCPNDPCSNFEIGTFNILGLNNDGTLCTESQVVFSTDITDLTTGYLWSTSNGLIGTSESFSTSFTIEDNIVITLQVTNGDGCADESSVSIIVTDCEDPCTDLLPIAIDLDTSFCLGDDPIATVESDVNLVDYEWMLDNILVSDSQTYSTSALTIPNVYTLTLAANDVNGCLYETMLAFEILDCTDPCLDYEIGEVISPSEVCIDIPFELMATSIDSTDQFIWTYENGETSEGSSANLSLAEEGEYTVLLDAVNEAGCSDSETLVIEVIDCTGDASCNDIYIPNVFSPNGDQINDTFKPLSDCIPNQYVFRIYDRWGGLVFETTDFTRAWNGKVEGREAQSGIYLWFLQYRTLGGDIVSDTGDVCIIN